MVSLHLETLFFRKKRRTVLFIDHNERIWFLGVSRNEQRISDAKHDGGSKNPAVRVGMTMTVTMTYTMATMTKTMAMTEIMHIVIRRRRRLRFSSIHDYDDDENVYCEDYCNYKEHGDKTC